MPSKPAKKNTKPKKAQPTQEWHEFDAGSKVLGRLATEIANLLMGKHRADYAKHKLFPVFVVVTNTDKLKVTGDKMKQKKYYRYSGYPGGLRTRSLEDQMGRDSRKVVEAAVFGMLPKNNLRPQRMKHLKLYAGVDHEHAAQLTTK